MRRDPLALSGAACLICVMSGALPAADKGPTVGTTRLTFSGKHAPVRLAGVYPGPGVSPGGYGDTGRGWRGAISSVPGGSWGGGAGGFPAYPVAPFGYGAYGPGAMTGYGAPSHAPAWTPAPVTLPSQWANPYAAPWPSAPSYSPSPAWPSMGPTAPMSSMPAPGATPHAMPSSPAMMNGLPAAQAPLPGSPSYGLPTDPSMPYPPASQPAPDTAVRPLSYRRRDLPYPDENAHPRMTRVEVFAPAGANVLLDGKPMKFIEEEGLYRFTPKKELYPDVVNHRRLTVELLGPEGTPTATSIVPFYERLGRVTQFWFE